MCFVFRMSVCCALFTLVACTSQQGVVKRVHAACQQMCQQRLQTCHELCHNNCKECNHLSYRTTVHHYEQFVHEQQVQGVGVSRDLNSYRDPLQCRKVTCDCLADNNVCKASCRGLTPQVLTKDV